MSAVWTADGTRRELHTDAGVLRYHEAGQGPPLLLLHGSGPGVTGWRNFGANLPVLAEHFRCLVLDLPGFGVSDPVPEPLIPAAHGAALRLLDGLGIPRADIIGNSMGGIVGGRIAVDDSDRIRRLVTVGGLGRNILAPMPGEGITLLAEFVEDPTRERMRAWLHSMVFDPALVTEALVEERFALATEEAALAGARSMYGRSAVAQMRAALDAVEAPLWTRLHRILAPTLLTWGRDDRVSPLDSAILPARVIPRAELHVFPQCGHWVMIEAKEAWERVVLAFLLRPEETPIGTGSYPASRDS